MDVDLSSLSQITSQYVFSSFLETDFYSDLIEKLETTFISTKKDCIDFLSIVITLKFLCPIKADSLPNSHMFFKSENVFKNPKFKQLKELSTNSNEILFFISIAFSEDFEIIFKELRPELILKQFIENKMFEILRKDISSYQIDLNFLSLSLNQNISRIHKEISFNILEFIFNHLNYKLNQNSFNSELSNYEGMAFGNIPIGFSDGLLWNTYSILFHVVYYFCNYKICSK